MQDFVDFVDFGSHPSIRNDQEMYKYLTTYKGIFEWISP